MAIYLKVTATAIIKIQDPYDLHPIQETIDATRIQCPYELIEEDYKFRIEDAD